MTPSRRHPTMRLKGSRMWSRQPFHCPWALGKHRPVLCAPFGVPWRSWRAMCPWPPSSCRRASGHPIFSRRAKADRRCPELDAIRGDGRACQAHAAWHAPRRELLHSHTGPQLEAFPEQRPSGIDGALREEVRKRHGGSQAASPSAPCVSDLDT